MQRYLYRTYPQMEGLSSAVPVRGSACSHPCPLRHHFGIVLSCLPKITQIIRPPDAQIKLTAHTHRAPDANAMVEFTASKNLTVIPEAQRWLCAGMRFEKLNISGGTMRLPASFPAPPHHQPKPFVYPEFPTT